MCKSKRKITYIYLLTFFILNYLSIYFILMRYIKPTKGYKILMKKLKPILSVIIVLTLLFSPSCGKEKSRLDMTEKERLEAALDDLYKGGNYDITVDIKYEIIDGDSSTHYNNNIIQNKNGGSTVAYIKRTGDTEGEDYYINGKYYSKDGKLLNPDFPMELTNETMMCDITTELMGDYAYVDGENYKTYEFKVSESKLKDLVIAETGMKATKASGSVILSLNGHLMGYKIKAITEHWINEEMFYEYDLVLTVTVNSINENATKIEIPFEYDK